MKRVALIVNDSFELSSADPTLAQKLRRAEVWARALFQIVPEFQLRASFDRAFADHDSEFVINAHSIKAAYDKLKAEYAIAKEIERNAEKPIGGTPASADLCEKCFGTGMEYIYRDGARVGVKPGCDHIAA